MTNAVHLQSGKLMVKGEMNDVFEVRLLDMRDDFFVNVELIPTENTRDNGIEEDYFSYDTLNETLVYSLKYNGYTVINIDDVKHIENQDW